MTILVNIFWLIALFFYLPVLVYRMVWLGKSRHGWGERWGFIPTRAGQEPLLWLHCVSVGEVNLVRSLVDAIRKDLPEYRLAVSATTDTGIARARELYGSFAVVFHYPLDFSWCVRRVLDRLRPTAIVLAELEVWPNLTLLAEKRGIPVVVVNGRLTERALHRYRLILPAVRYMMSKLTAVAAQDETIAQRFITLGVPADRVRVLGTMKFDTAQIVDELPGTNALADAVGLPRREAPNRPPVWVCGQTGPGEELHVLQAYQQLLKLFPDLRLVIVPRKPERFDEVAQLIEKHGFAVLRRSKTFSPSPGEDRTKVFTPPAPRPSPLASCPVILIDTMGELRTVYPLADVVLVGRSLVPMGGSDVMEVAGLAKPILVGPYTDNFTEPVRRLREAGGLIQLPEPTGHIAQSLEMPNWAGVLSEAVRNLLCNPAQAREMGEKARQVLMNNKGATAAHLELIIELIDR